MISCCLKALRGCNDRFAFVLLLLCLFFYSVFSFILFPCYSVFILSCLVSFVTLPFLLFSLLSCLVSLVTLSFLLSCPISLLLCLFLPRLVFHVTLSSLYLVYSLSFYQAPCLLVNPFTCPLYVYKC